MFSWIFEFVSQKTKRHDYIHDKFAGSTNAAYKKTYTVQYHWSQNGFKFNFCRPESESTHSLGAFGNTCHPQSQIWSKSHNQREQNGIRETASQLFLKIHRGQRFRGRMRANSILTENCKVSKVVTGPILFNISIQIPFSVGNSYC